MLAEEVRDILHPYVGPIIADTCVRATALSVGKTCEQLDTGDIPVLSANIRRLLAPIASRPTIETIVARISA